MEETACHRLSSTSRPDGAAVNLEANGPIVVTLWLDGAANDISHRAADLAVIGMLTAGEPAGESGNQVDLGEITLQPDDITGRFSVETGETPLSANDLGELIARGITAVLESCTTGAPLP